MFESWLTNLLKARFKLVVFIDGLSQDDREAVKDQRMNQHIQNIRHLLGETVQAHAMPDTPLVHPSAVQVVRSVLARHGVQVHQLSIGEADHHIAAFCKEEGFAVVSRDSDFFAYDVAVIPWELLEVTDEGVFAHLFTPALRMAHFGFSQPWQLQLLPLLVGNDAIDSWTDLVRLHREVVVRYMPGSPPFSPNIISAIVAFLRDYPHREAFEAQLPPLLSSDVMCRLLRHAQFHDRPDLAPRTAFAFHQTALTADQLSGVVAHYQQGRVTGHLMTVLAFRTFKSGLHIEPEGGLFAVSTVPDTNVYVHLGPFRQGLYGLLFGENNVQVREYVRCGSRLRMTEAWPVAVEGLPAASALLSLSLRAKLHAIHRLFGLPAQPCEDALVGWLEQQPPEANPQEPASAGVGAGARVGIEEVIPYVFALRKLVVDYPAIRTVGQPVLAAF
eukprot:EG_transcript_11652